MSTLLRAPGLTAYLFGNFVSITGSWAQRVTIYWIAWEMTYSTSFLGLLAALDLLPSVLAAPLAGAIADTRPALKFTRAVQVVSAVPPFIIVVLLMTDSVTLPILMVLTLVTGILNGLDHPLRLLLVGQVAPKGQVSGAVALNSVVFNVGRMIGPAMGGWGVSAGVPILVFAYNAATFLLFALILSRLPQHNNDDREPHAARIFDGLFRWHDVLLAFDRPLALAFAQFAIIAALIRPVFELLPGFVDGLAVEGLVRAQAFSLLTSAQGFGAMIGALTASWLLRKCSFGAVAMTSGMMAILSELVFLGSSGFFVALAAMSLLSGAILINGIATQVALQTQLALQVRGRALSLYTITFRGMPAIGALFVGATAEIFPLRAVSSSLAILAFCLMLWIIALRSAK